MGFLLILFVWHMVYRKTRLAEIDTCQALLIIINNHNNCPQ